MGKAVAPVPVRVHRVAEAGLGHPGSQVAAALAEFAGRIYLGTVAPGSTATEDRGRILSADPAGKRWRTDFEAPLLPVSDELRNRAAWLTSGLGGGRQRTEVRTEVLAAAQGVTSFAVFQGPGDRRPCLYAGTMSVRGARILRSQNGRHFEPVSAPGLGDDRIFAFRDLTAWRGRLYVLPVGMAGADRLDRVYPPDPLLAVSTDPAEGDWHSAIEPGFGQADNIGISALAVFGDSLFAATANAARGFQLWRLDEPDGEWAQVLADGAGRFSPNLMVTAMAEFDGALYLGTGIPGLGYDPETDTGPAACELIRLNPDGSWDLVMGEPRFSEDGLKRPLTGMGPGFSNRFNTGIGTLSVQGGRLYAGTRNGQALDSAGDTAAEAIVGGAELWSTGDGIAWQKLLPEPGSVSRTMGFSAALATGRGLWLGTHDQTRTIGQRLKLRDRSDLLGTPAPAEGFELWRVD